MLGLYATGLALELFLGVQISYAWTTWLGRGGGGAIDKSICSCSCPGLMEGQARPRDHSFQETSICWCRYSWPEEAVSVWVLWLPRCPETRIRSQCDLSDPQRPHQEARAGEAGILPGPLDPDHLAGLLTTVWAGRLELSVCRGSVMGSGPTWPPLPGQA